MSDGEKRRSCSSLWPNTLYAIRLLKLSQSKYAALVKNCLHTVTYKYNNNNSPSRWVQLKVETMPAPNLACPSEVLLPGFWYYS